MPPGLQVVAEAIDDAQGAERILLKSHPAGVQKVDSEATS